MAFHEKAGRSQGNSGFMLFETLFFSPLLCFAATMLTFFIAGLLYLLRFERVDNLGAYSTPSETGLLIPSDFDNMEQITTMACPATNTATLS